jgi:transcription antitermination factor NusG
MSVGIENNNEIYWYALYTMPRTEKKVEQRLSLKNIEIYLPLTETIRIWTDRKKKIKIPLIPGFVFIRCKQKEISEALETEGVLNVVSYLKKPAKIHEYEINNLKILINEPQFIQLNEELDISKGDDVEVIRGPFIGLIGKCIRLNGKYRIIVEIKALDKKIEVSVAYSFLKK